jgi:hypothetical protein
MSKRVLVLLVSMALLFTVAASAATTVTAGCGSAGAGAPPQPTPPGPPFTPVITSTVTCAAFPIPAGQTLSDVQLSFKNDWQLGAPGGPDTLVFTYTLTGFNIGSVASTVTGSGALGSTSPVTANQPLTCSVTGDLVTCDDPVSIPAPGTFNAITISIAAAWTSGGLDFSGNEGTTINASYTFAPTPPPPPPPSCPPFLVRYAANLDTGDSLIDLTNSGGNPGNANICANVYAFSPDEQLVSCCSCPITPDALVSLSVVGDLTSNTLTPAHPSSVVIKLVPSAGAVCNAANVPAANLATGLLAWGTTRHGGVSGDSGPVFQTTETPFSQSCLSPSELARITSFCGFIQANGSGFGICRSCRLGGQGAVK